MSFVTPAKPDLLCAAVAFIDRPSTSAPRRAQFAAVVEDIPIYKTTDNYSTDIERRIEAIRKIQNDILTRHPDKFFNPIQVAYLMQLDVGFLEDALDCGLVGNIFERATKVEPFVRACLGKGLDKQNEAEEDSINENGKRAHTSNDLTDSGAKRTRNSADAASSSTSKATQKPRRNKTVCRKAKERDGHLCVISKLEHPDSAHIIPFTITSSETHILKARSAILALLGMHGSDRFTHEIRKILFPRDTEESGLGEADRLRNIFCLNPWFHRGFDSCVFGLKPVNLPPRPDPNDNTIEYISVEWRYLPKQLARALEEDHAKYLRQRPTQERSVALCQMNLDSDEITDLFRRHLKYPEGNDVRPFIDENSVVIESGRRFEIPTYKEDSASTTRLLELAWLARCIASMSGAAECVDMLRDEPDSDWAQAALAEYDRAIRLQEEENERDRFAIYRAETDDESESGTESPGTAL